MLRRLLGPVAALALLAAAAHAQSPQDAWGDARHGPPTASDVTDILLRVNGPLEVRASDTLRTVVVAGHDATVNGIVREQLVVLGGTARIAGTVDGTVVVAGGRVELAPTARIGHGIVLYHSTLQRMPGAVVGGGVQERSGSGLAAGAAGFLWTGITAALAVAALLFATIGGRQLGESAALVRTAPVLAGVSGLGAWLALPFVVAAAFVSVIGIPLGIAILVAVIPALALLGYLVSGAVIGTIVLRRLHEGEPGAGDVAAVTPGAAVVGVLALQVVTIVPGIGGLLAMLASMLGVGALLARAWRIRHPAFALPAWTLTPPGSTPHPRAS